MPTPTSLWWPSTSKVSMKGRHVHFLFVFKIFEDLSWDHWITCFGLLVMSALGFKARMDPITCVLRHLHAMESSDSPLVRHHLTSWRPTANSHAHVQNLRLKPCLLQVSVCTAEPIFGGLGVKPGLHVAFLPPATKLGQGYIFTGMCNSVHGEGHGPGGCMVRGMHGPGGCMVPGGVPGPGGSW